MDALTETVNVLGDAVQQMQAAHDKPRNDPLSIMEAALREIVARAEQCKYRNPGDLCEILDGRHPASPMEIGHAMRELGVYVSTHPAREALAKVEAFYASE